MIMIVMTMVNDEIENNDVILLIINDNDSEMIIIMA